MKRTFWWELIFISVLLFLLAGARVQKKLDVAALAEPALIPPITLGVAVTPLSPVLALK